MKVLVTGTAGFIGYHVSNRLLNSGNEVLGIDNLNEYYDPNLKRDRLALLQSQPGFHFNRLDISNRTAISSYFTEMRPDSVIHLAAQAGVRYSLSNPHAYVESNLVGFMNILEGSRYVEARHLVYASSSSVYGANTKTPFSTHDPVDHPLSLYAASKKANELMAHTYSHLYRLPTTGLRFFTVYGPWGRPDMALFTFTKSILEGHPIEVYNYGKMKRDFTYVDDIVEGIIRVHDSIPAPDAHWNPQEPDPASSSAPYRVYNIGNHRPVELLHFIETLEKCLGRKAIKNLLPIQPGDVPSTNADVSDLMRDVGFKPDTPIEVGIRRFVEWYTDYYSGP